MNKNQNQIPHKDQSLKRNQTATDPRFFAVFDDGCNRTNHFKEMEIGSREEASTIWISSRQRKTHNTSHFRSN